MIRQGLKRVASKLSPAIQNELKRAQFALEIRRNRFFTDEQEYGLLETWVSEGDWVLDIGANVGHYTARLSSLVGSAGRVIAFEPVPETFALLAANVARLPLRNVTLLNVAASNESTEVGVSVPKFETGLDNYYMAHVTNDGKGIRCLAIAVDVLGLPVNPSLVKIDAEGHESSVLEGMARMLERCHPVLIVEDNSAAIGEYLANFGYMSRQLAGSSNRVFEYGCSKSLSVEKRATVVSSDQMSSGNTENMS